MRNGYTLEELLVLAMKESENHLNYQAIYEQAKEKLEGNSFRAIVGEEFENTTDAEGFAAWAKERGLPVYHVAERSCTIGASFTALYNLEVER